MSRNNQLKMNSITIDIPSNFDFISIRELVNLVFEASIKLNLIEVEQKKWEFEELKMNLAKEFCFDLNSSGFCDNQGVIEESDKPPAMQFEFSWDAKMQIEVARGLFSRRRCILQQSKFHIRHQYILRFLFPNFLHFLEWALIV